MLDLSDTPKNTLKWVLWEAVGRGIFVPSRMEFSPIMEKQLEITCKAALLAAIMALVGSTLFAAAPPSRDEVTITGRLHADT